MLPDILWSAHDSQKVKSVERRYLVPCVKLYGRKSMLIVTPKIPKDARMFDIQMLKDENVHERKKPA